MAGHALDSSIDILLMGRTGNGKSATGNSILMKEDAFESSADVTSQTVHASIDYSEFNGCEIKVVDSPGLGDTRLDDVADIKQFITAVEYAIASNPKGYHAILYVVKFSARYSKQEVESVNNLKKILGSDFIKNYGVLVMTGGDSFESDKGIRKKNITFEEWVSSQGEPNFKSLVKECGGRVILFNNSTDDEEKRRSQVAKLLKIIGSLSIKGKRYTNKEFERAEKERERLLKSLTRPFLKEEYVKELGIISLKFSQMKYKTDEIEQLEELSKRAYDLYEKIKEDDKGSNLLQSSMGTVVKAKEAIDEQIVRLAPIRAQEQEQAENVRKLDEQRAKLEKERAELEAQRKIEHERMLKMREDEALIAKEKLRQMEEEKMSRFAEEQENLKKQQEEMKIKEEEMKRKEEEMRKEIMEDAKKKSTAIDQEYQALRQTQNSGLLITKALEYVSGFYPFQKVKSWFSRS